ncbi:hypothetical protein BOX37_20395 [Nocardia mangyaensis]|uniref:Helix-turn-helix domain-containing protein n=1 Tax=Nocardia mangyaensis TaxID=2213200 RepID=A0A1J0VVE0_9NOCA|nr:hypothetical protein [Nocardia mangyaensis]APE35911.1 hypothetical protein BOX37_20395 [Nocardia mangyaensis]
MILGDGEVRAAYYCVAEFVHRRRRAGVPIPDAVRGLLGRLDWEIQIGPTGSAPAEAEDELIDVQQAAVILGRSDREIRRIARDLDGTRTTGSWVFRRRVIEEYAAARGVA